MGRPTAPLSQAEPGSSHPQVLCHWLSAAIRLVLRAPAAPRVTCRRPVGPLLGGGGPGDSVRARVHLRRPRQIGQTRRQPTRRPQPVQGIGKGAQRPGVGSPGISHVNEYARLPKARRPSRQALPPATMLAPAPSTSKQTTPVHGTAPQEGHHPDTHPLPRTPQCMSMPPHLNAGEMAAVDLQTVLRTLDPRLQGPNQGNRGEGESSADQQGSACTPEAMCVLPRGMPATCTLLGQVYGSRN